MLIKQTYKQFSNFIHVGFYTFYIELDKDGAEVSTDELVESAKYYNRIMFVGDDINNQASEVVKFVKKINKLNEDAIIQLFTEGTSFPVGGGSLKNTIYAVHLSLKNGDVAYDNRIIPSVVAKYAGCDSYFCFVIKNGDDIDEVGLIMGDCEISASQVFLIPTESMKDKAKEYAQRIECNMVEL